MTGRHRLVGVPALVLAATVAQLLVATVVPGIDRFDDKAFGARLVAYPAAMLLVPALWWALVGRRRPAAEPPHLAFALVMAGFLVDTTGNSLDLYDAVGWWDDLSHVVNWCLLLTGLGLLLAPESAYEDTLGDMTAGTAGAVLGALLLPRLTGRRRPAAPPPPR